MGEFLECGSFLPHSKDLPAQTSMTGNNAGNIGYSMLNPALPDVVQLSRRQTGF